MNKLSYAHEFTRYSDVDLILGQVSRFLVGLTRLWVWLVVLVRKFPRVSKGCVLKFNFCSSLETGRTNCRIKKDPKGFY